MSAFATPLFQNVQPAVFPEDSRYGFRSTEADDAKIIAFPDVRGNTRLAISGLHKALGQYSVDMRTSGILLVYEIDKVLIEFGVKNRKTRYNWRKRMVEAGLLERLDDGYRIINYAKANRTKEEWFELDRVRRERRNLKRNLRRAAARKARREAALVPTVGNQLPIQILEPPDTPTLRHISGGGSQQLPKPFPAPDLSGLKVLTQRPRSPLRAEPDLQTAPSTSAQHGSKTSMSSFGAVLAKVLPGNLGALEGGSLVSAVASRPIKPARPAQPRPLSKTLGSDKSEEEQNLEGGSYASWGLAIVERRKKADAEAAKAKAKPKSKDADQASP
jgi:hypothetical protein